MIILFYGEGRLGNQVFQYQALSRLADRGGWILAAGLEELEECCLLVGPRLRVINRHGWVKRAIKYLVLPLLLRPASRWLRLLGYAREGAATPEGRAGDSGELMLRRGLLQGLVFVDGGYYQSPRVLGQHQSLSALRLQPALIDRARARLAGLTPCTSRDSTAFVHVRRGDFRHWSVSGARDPCLPERYYRAAITALRAQISIERLLFVTDDPAWVSECFADIGDKHVLSGGAALDFAVMADSQAGVLSNSSFALAAALLSQAQPLIAPRYWLGFRVGRWIPPGLQPLQERLQWLDVPAPEQA